MQFTLLIIPALIGICIITQVLGSIRHIRQKVKWWKTEPISEFITIVSTTDPFRGVDQKSPEERLTLLKNGTKELVEKLEKKIKERSSLSHKEAPQYGSYRSYTEMATDLMLRQRHLKVPSVEVVLHIVQEQMSDCADNEEIKPNLTMVWGLTGTVASLFFSVSSISSAISHLPTSASLEPFSVLDAMRNELSGPISSIAFSFIPTFLGAVGSIILTFFLRQLESHQADTFSKLRMYIVRDLGPSILHDTLDEQFEVIAAKLNTNIEEISKHSKHFQTTAVKAVTELSQSLQNADTMITRASQALNTVADTLKQLKEDIQKEHDDLRRDYQTITEIFTSAKNEYAGNTKKMIEKIGGYQTDFNRTSNDIVTKIESASGWMDAGGAAFEKGAKQFESISKTIGSDAYAAIASRAEEFQSAMDSTVDQLAKVETDLSELMARLDPRMLSKNEWQRVIDALEDITAVVKSADESEERYRQALNGYSEMISEAGREMRTFKAWLSPRMADTPERQAAQGNSLRLLTTIATRLAELPETIGEQLTKQQPEDTVTPQIYVTLSAILDTLTELKIAMARESDFNIHIAKLAQLFDSMAGLEGNRQDFVQMLDDHMVDTNLHTKMHRGRLVYRAATNGVQIEAPQVPES